MKTPTFYMISLIFILPLLCLWSCDNSTGPEDIYDFPEAIDSVATNISLYVHPAYDDSLLTIINIPEEGTIVFDYDNPRYPYGSYYRIYIRADGFYTEMTYCRPHGTIYVDLEAIPQVAYSITGTVFGEFYYLEPFHITGPDGFDERIQLDGLRRFGLANLPAGIYAFSNASDLDHQFFYIENTPGTDYQELQIRASSVVEAPYIYLYPERQTDIQVRLAFPAGGHITESEPPYNRGWNVNVTPDGVIDGRYNYLFYEGVIENLPQRGTGWLLNGENLERNIYRLLRDLGFNDREIEDFTDFWIPVIEGHPYYAFYYFDPNSIIRLDVNPAPDNILRVFFIIRPLDNPIRLRAPDVPDRFSRDGFAVTEWGVIDWRE